MIVPLRRLVFAENLQCCCRELRVNQCACKEAIRLSRPINATNQGTPAAGT
jgi:hypothetical protein